MYLYITSVHFPGLGLANSESPEMDREQKTGFFCAWLPMPISCALADLGSWFGKAFGDLSKGSFGLPDRGWRSL